MMSINRTSAGLIRLRYLLPALVFLGIALFVFGLLMLRAARRAAITSTIQQGRALTTVLLASASNIIKSDRLATDIAIDGIILKFNLARQRSFRSEEEFLRYLVADLGLLRAQICDRFGKELAVLKIQPRGLSNGLDSLQALFDTQIEVSTPFDIIYDFYQLEGQRFLFAVLPYRSNQFVKIVSPWRFGQFADEQLSLPYLLNRLSLEAGVEYIVLQNQDGIVFASKQVSQMDRIDADLFLKSALAADTMVWRFLMFQDRQVLEVVQRFDSGGEFYGLFRVGLSLYGYRQIVASFKRQLWFLLGLLFVLALAGLAIIGGRQTLKMAQESLKRAETFSMLLHDAVSAAVFSVDNQMRITTSNPMAKKYLGLPEEPGPGGEYDRLFPGDPFKVRKVMTEKRGSNFQTHVMGVSGAIDLAVSTNPIVDDHGQLNGVLVVAQDISERLALERQAQQAHRLAELGGLAASLAHDIRNPLNAISIAIQRLRHEVVPQNGQQEFNRFLDVLDSEHKKLNQLVERILMVARTQRLERESIDVRQTIEEAIAAYRQEATSRQIDIKTTLVDVRARLNKPLFEGIIRNLVQNALEAVGSGGTIEVVAEVDAARRLVVRVTDNGPGISPDEQRQIFKPFYTTKAKGSGLGLASALRAALDHGGDLQVDSRVGGPTTFTLTVPLGE